MDPNSGNVDPITFEILSHRLHQITREMGTTLERVGGTVNTTQMHDYMTALYRANGDVLSAGAGMARHVACARVAVKRIIQRFEKEEGIYPDDLFLLNDPYIAAIHQSDINIISPIHHKDDLVGWSATFVHVMDVGAMSPGGNSPGATEICHEGIRIPGLKLVDRGILRRDVFESLINMTRQPVMVGLDLKCQIAANNVAKSRVKEMIAQYGAELMDRVSLEMINYTEAALRKRLIEIPDGTWNDSATIQSGETWKITLTMEKKRDQLLFDFTGTDKQATTGINLPYHATVGACFEAVLSAVGYDLPKNNGGLHPIKVVVPEGTLVSAKYPAPVSLNTTSSLMMARYLARSVLMQMLGTSEKWKSEVRALKRGNRSVRHAGVNQYGKYYVSTLMDLEGSGASATNDGANSGGEMTCYNVEWLEMNFPLLYLFHRHVKDGAGAGKFRGGAGAEAALAIHDAPEEKIKGVAYGVAGLRNSGQGIFGGYPGAPSVIKLLEGTKLRDFMAQNRIPKEEEQLGGQARLLPYCEFYLKKDDVLYLRRGSGGGYGDPLERPPHLVLMDVLNGLISKEVAQAIYGVAIDDNNFQVDSGKTHMLRAALLGNRLRGQE